MHQVWLLDLVTMAWMLLAGEPGDAQPNPRYSHSAAVRAFMPAPSYGQIVGSFMYVFGGIDVDGELLADHWRLCLVTRVWCCLAGRPTARAGHTAAVLDGAIYVYGGIHK